MLTDPPCGYALSAGQWREVGSTLELHGVRVERRRGGGAFVPLRQSQRTLVPLLLDERAKFGLTAGRPVAKCG